MTIKLVNCEFVHAFCLIVHGYWHLTDQENTLEGPLNSPTSQRNNSCQNIP
jgi:hypothetical protein